MRVLVLSMTTWGEMGNWLSGRALTQAVARCRPDWEVTQQPVDRLLPALAEVGARIRRVTMDSRTPAERSTGYGRIMQDLLADYPTGMEEGAPVTPAVRQQLDQLGAAIEKQAPDMIVGTKGVICRLAIASTNNRIPVVNYVTNHGHFQFAVHNCPGAAAHLTRMDAAGAFLQARWGYPQDRVACVGYLVGGADAGPSDAGGTVDAPAADRLHVVVVSNRGGGEYVDILQRLLEHRRAPGGTFIALNDPALCAEARERIERAGQSDRWSVLEKLDHEDFVRMLASRHERGAIALVTKASPNSIMEAVYLGIPMFLLRSGLPMEDWSCDVVTGGGFGAVADTVDGLWPAIAESIDTPERLTAISAREQEYAARALDQTAVVARILAALERAGSRQRAADLVNRAG